MIYTLQEIRDGTGWPDGVRFQVVDEVVGEARPCSWQTHYGCLGPRWAVDPGGEQAQSGNCGMPTDNPSGLCDEHESTWNENYAPVWGALPAKDKH